MQHADQGAVNRHAKETSVGNQRGKHAIKRNVARERVDKAPMHTQHLYDARKTCYRAGHDHCRNHRLLGFHADALCVGRVLPRGLNEESCPGAFEEERKRNDRKKGNEDTHVGAARRKDVFEQQAGIQLCRLLHACTAIQRIQAQICGKQGRNIIE